MSKLDFSHLRGLWNQAVTNGAVAALESGKLGKHVVGAPTLIYVRGRPGFVHVTRRDQTTIEAKVKGAIVYEEDYPVEFRLENQTYVIQGKSVHPSLPDSADPGSAFTFLSDTPKSYVGESGKFVSVKTDESGLEFTTTAQASWLTDWSYRSSNRNTAAAFAWKGNKFIPYKDVALSALAYYGTLVAGATYRAAVITGTATPGNIATIQLSASFTLPGTLVDSEGGWIWLYFPTPILLSTGITYGLMCGRTDGSNTYALPVPASGGAAENGPPLTGSSGQHMWRIAKAVPVVGDTIDQVFGNHMGQGFIFRYP